MLLFNALPNIIMICKFVVGNIPPFTSFIIGALMVAHHGASLQVAPSVVVA
jgi:hypothetical protein